MRAFYTPSESKEELAGLETRLVAFALDVLLLLTLVGLADFLTFSSDEAAILLKPERLLHLLLGWLYFAGAETSPYQATLGKYLLNLRATTASGKRIGFKAASIRYFAKPVTLIMALGQLLSKAPNDPRHTYHDKLSHTQVIVR